MSDKINNKSNSQRRREIPVPPQNPTKAQMVNYMILLMSEISRLNGLIDGMQESINWRFEQLEKKND